MERLAKQAEELKQRNRELQDELKHVTDQFKQTAAATTVNQKANPNNVSAGSASAS
jgi:cell division septum initiation protein DivIVA